MSETTPNSPTMAEIIDKLSSPFSVQDVGWRITNTTKDKNRGLAEPYVQSRAIQARLDDCVGPFNWYADFRPWHPITEGGQVKTESQLCGIAVYCEERGEWVQKWDGAEDTDYEPVKGGISDSFKRAAVMWGIGRYLYGLLSVWVDVEQRGKSYIIPDKELSRLNQLYEGAVKGKSSNVAQFPGSGQQPAADTTPPFDYAISSVEPRKFASGTGMVLRMRSADGKKNVEAFLEKADQSLAEGICLKNVKLTPFESAGYRSHIMEGYEVA